MSKNNEMQLWKRDHFESKIDKLIKRNFSTNVIDLIASMIATDPELRPKHWATIVEDLIYKGVSSFQGIHIHMYFV